MANSFLTGTGVPTGVVGEISDYYRDTATNLIYYYAPTGWESVPSLIPTPDGVGTTWHFGNGTPSNGVGSSGDYYRDDDNGSVYRKHNVNGWEALGSLDFIGVYGVQWGEGTGAPANTAPLNNLPAGSFYLDVSTSDIYYKDNTLTWSLKGQLGSGTGGGASVTVVDALDSTSGTAALSANQGRILSETIANLTANDVGADEAGAADTAEQNAKDYADGLVTGLWDDRGTHDASLGNYPSSGGSGVAGAILKGDIWTISVAGTLGANTVEVGDTVRALVDGPDGDSTWAVGQNNIGWIPENVVNKVTDLTSPNNITFPTTQAVVDGLGGKQNSLPAPTGASKFLREDLTWQDAASNLEVINNGTTLVTVAANKNYFILAKDNFTVNASLISTGASVEILCVRSGSDSLITFTGSTVYDYGGNALASMVVRRGNRILIFKDSSIIKVKLINQSLYQDFKLFKLFGSSTAVDINIAEITASRSISMPDKDVHLGSIPAIATTNNNSNTGTRTTITGGQLNTVTGTDNSVYNSSNNTVSGLRNTVVGGGVNSAGVAGNVVAGTENSLYDCLKVTTDGGMQRCTFNRVFNTYTSPEAPLTLQTGRQDVNFHGWINDMVSLKQWPRGYTITGEKRKIISGTYGVSGASYLSKVTTSVALACISTGATSSNLIPVLETVNKPISAAQAGLGGEGFAEHELHIEAYDPITAQRFIGTRRVIDNAGTITVDTIGTDVATGGFTLSLAITNVTDTLQIAVRNTANTNNCHWTGTLNSKLVHIHPQF